MSFEGVGDTFFKSDYLFGRNFIKRMGKSLKKANASQELVGAWENIEDLSKDDDATFKSVILAGVYDIKNMKLKLRPDEEKKYNSPWNIAVDFEIDMSFSPKEIATMLQEYEDDHHTGMDIAAMSEEIYKYTNGYPYLVSAICKFVEKSLNAVWTKDSV